MKPYNCPFWATFNQIQLNYGSVKKGKKSTLVVFWKWLEVETHMLDENGKPIKENIPFLRYSRVFNLEQAEGITWEKLMQFEERDINLIEECLKIVRDYNNKPPINYGDGRAYYSPIDDLIQIT